MVTPLDQLIPKHPLRGMSHIQLNEQKAEMQRWGKRGKEQVGRRPVKKAHFV